MKDYKKQSLYALGVATDSELGTKKERYSMQKSKILALLAIEQAITRFAVVSFIGCLFVFAFLMLFFA